MTTIDQTTFGCMLDGGSTGFTSCILDSIFASGGSPALIGLMMGGTLLASLYIAGDGDIVVPAVMTILLGSILVPLLPSQYSTMAYSVAVLGITAAGMSVMRRYILRGTF